MQAKLNLAETSGYRLEKRTIQLLEQKNQELETELSDEQKKNSQLLKETQKCERKYKELLCQIEEEKKSHSKLQKNNDKLHEFLKTYKRQVEESNEMASVNFSKFRKAQRDLEDFSDKADQQENQLIKMRNSTRSSLSCNRSDSLQVNICDSSYF